MFLYRSREQKPVTFAPRYDDLVGAESGLATAGRDLGDYRDSSLARENATAEAYERRNKAIFDATGVQLENPYRASPEELKRSMRERQFSGSRGFKNWRDGLEQDWQRRVEELARERPEAAGIIQAQRPITEDAFEVVRGSERAMGEAQAAAERAGVNPVRQVGIGLRAGFESAARDPLQVGALFVGGGIAAPSKFVVGRILQTMFTEAAVNAGVEAGLQLASENWRKEAGVAHGPQHMLEQVGLAAMFGGAFGGLVRGGHEVLRLTGRAVPEEVLARAAAGEPQPGDMGAIGEALGLKLDPETLRTAELAAEQSQLDRAAFGEPPAGLSTAEAESLAAQAVRAVDQPPETAIAMARDIQERTETIERIVRQQFPLGKEPPRPVTLMQFLASRGVGGIRDESGELAAMGLTRKFVPGGGALVRKNGKSLDYAREVAAEAGFFDDLYGSPDAASQLSTPDDLLRLLRAEQGGEPAYAARLDGGRVFDWQEHDAGVKRRDAYRRVLEEIDTAHSELDLDGRIDDAVLIRASELVDDETDAAAALERALEEDYKNYDISLSERGEGISDDPDYDIPFFEDARAGSEARGDAGTQGGDGASRGRGADEAFRAELQSAGAPQGAQARQGLRQPGDTPEPATPEASEIADLVLTEARRSEATAAGEQTLIDGVAPVSTRERLEAQGKKPTRGGDAPPPAGGLFDIDAQKQIDIWDAMPASRDADGTVKHTTYDAMVQDAERTDFLGDLIQSCKD